MNLYDTYKSKYAKMLTNIKHYVYAYVDTSTNPEQILYIGKGINARVLDHLHPDDSTEKHKVIIECAEKGSLRIDILRHGIESDKLAKIIEATCIDLFGVDQLLNAVRGHGIEMGRMSMEEINQVIQQEMVVVDPSDAGIAVILNSTFKSGMSSLQLFEATRGIWRGVPKGDHKYAYATYSGIVKEVYHIESWVPAGSNQYFTREFDDEELAGRKEFIGKLAPDLIRQKYKGKAIEIPRSYGSPLMAVGID